MGLPIPDYPDYLIEKDGRIYSLKRNKWLKSSPGSNGYYGIELANHEGRKRFSVHRLVAMTYIPNPNELPQVNHKDENKANNHVSNLEWCSAKYNMNYGIAAKTRHSKIDYKKEIYRENAIRNGKKASLPVLQYNKTGEFIKRFESIKEASRQTGANSSHISECCNGNRYKSVGGFIWKYERRSDLLGYQF